MDQMSPSVKSFGLGKKASRGIILPPVEPTQRFSVPNSSTQQIKFRLSGFDEMPEFIGTESRTKVFPMIPKAGRSIPKLGVEEMVAAANNERKFSLSTKTTKNKSLLKKFDEALDDEVRTKAHSKIPGMKTRLLKPKVEKIKSHLDSGRTDVFQYEMEKMRDHMDMLGSYGSAGSDSKVQYAALKGGPDLIKDPLPGSPRFKRYSSDEIDNVERNVEKMDDLMRQWMPQEDLDALTHNGLMKYNQQQEEALRNSLVNTKRVSSSRNKSSTSPTRSEVKRIPSLLLKKTSSFTGRSTGNAKPTGRKLINSEPNSSAKLKVIADGFRKTLNPFSTRDPRDLIKTPNVGIVDKLNKQHYDSVRKQDEEERTQMSNNNNKGKQRNASVGTGVGNGPVPDLFLPVLQVHKVPSASGAFNSKRRLQPPLNVRGNGIRSASVSRTGSQSLAGIMDFKTLLERQTERPYPRPEANKSSIDSPNGVVNSSTGLGFNANSREILSPMSQSQFHSFISGPQLQGKLIESTKSIDNAAKVAQTLGSLMSKVALQQNANKAPSNSPIESKMTSPRRFLQIEEVQRRAARLAEVAEEAHRSLKMHSIACGGASPLASPNHQEYTKTISRNTSNTKATAVIKSTRMSEIPRIGESGENGGGYGERVNQIDSKTDSKTFTQTQTEPLTQQNPKKNAEGNFEFVQDMSFTDQLMLKKLRGMQFSWSDNEEDEDDDQSSGDEIKHIGVGNGGLNHRSPYTKKI